ncbi:MAG: TRAP transporter small permease subunit [Chloroflexi bacterium]|nr:TRAP transporter small permease subunit [Chloroflexota bacterium]
MERYLFFIDNVSAWVGKIFAWSIVLLTAATSYDVVARYGFSAPTTWAFDASYILYGTLFMMGGAYTLSRNGHVRGDMFYRTWSVRTQGMMDLILYLLFFFPGIIALMWAGYEFAAYSWSVAERSNASPGGPPIYHFKTIIPISAAFLCLQGVAETIRSVIAIRTGEWPRRLADVEETGEAI